MPGFKIRKATARYRLRSSSGRTSVVLLILISFIMLSSKYDPSLPTEPYPLLYPANFGNRFTIPDDNPTTQQGVYLGRLLFYEQRLSINNSISCGSCHQQEKAFTDGLAFSKGADQVLTTRSSMSLVNLLWTRRFFWDGRVEGLENQAVFPLTNLHEMGQSLAVSAKKLSQSKQYSALFKQVYGNGAITGAQILKAIAQFERTLISADSRYDQYLRGAYQPTVEELEGMALFNQSPQPDKGIRGANCAHCHGGVKTYMELFHNNGLDSIPKDIGMEALTGLAGDRGRFKVPTLRNIALTSPYMHDGRFKTLDEVVDHYSEHIMESTALSSVLRNESNQPEGKSLNLSPQEKKQLIAFLNMLTDSAFVSDPRFSDPNQFSISNLKSPALP